jgi:hypothetical protein
MTLRRGHERAVHHWHGLPGCFGVCGDLLPDVEVGGIQRQANSMQEVRFLMNNQGLMELLGAYFVLLKLWVVSLRVFM